MGRALGLPGWSLRQEQRIKMISVAGGGVHELEEVRQVRALGSTPGHLTLIPHSGRRGLTLTSGPLFTYILQRCSPRCISALEMQRQTDL